MNLSIAVCTRNRAASLARMLDSVTRLDLPAFLTWELVIVNNGSTDGTSQTIASFADRLPIREETEPRPGLSNARNKGVSAARGRYIIWTDDDVLVDRAWLSAYVAAFDRWPDAAVFGGKVLPIFEGTAPGWFTANLDTLFGPIAYRDFGDDPLPLSADRVPFGANYVVRTEEQRAFPYDPELGVAPGRNRIGEETAVIAAILASGGSGMWVPAAKVSHCIAANRITTRYVGRHFQAHGETLAYLENAGRPRASRGVPRWMWRRMLTQALRYYASRCFDPPAVWLEHMRRYQIGRGEVRYLAERAQRALAPGVPSPPHGGEKG